MSQQTLHGTVFHTATLHLSHFSKCFYTIVSRIDRCCNVIMQNITIPSHSNLIYKVIHIHIHTQHTYTTRVLVFVTINKITRLQFYKNLSLLLVSRTQTPFHRVILLPVNESGEQPLMSLCAERLSKDRIWFLTALLKTRLVCKQCNPILSSFSCFVGNNSKTTARVIAVCEICMSTVAIKCSCKLTSAGFDFMQL